MRLRLLAVAIGFAFSAPAEPRERPSDYGAWFLHQFGPAQPKNEFEATLLTDAKRVFDAVAAVADKKPGRTPQLLAVDKNNGIEAQALPDGTIVINLELLRLCYGGSPSDLDRGRARLAFVLGHEMAHLAFDDSWHAQTFSNHPELGLDWTREPSEARQAKEFHADEAGFTFMAMAGFAPQAVLGGKSDFLADWAGHVRTETFPPDGRHPRFDERAQMLRTHLEDLARIMPFFRFGVRLAQIGRFEDAVRLLEYVRARFPSREVEGNLGLAWYQRAVSRLGQCGSAEGVRFKLPLALDPETLLARIRLRGETPECDRAVRDDLAEAERALAAATEHDPAYAAARLSLAAVWIVDGRPLKALDLLRAFRVAQGADAPFDSRVALVEAIALYLSGFELRIDMTDGALQALEDLEAKLRTSAEPTGGDASAVLLATAAFDRARILQERGRPEAARHAWEEFLKLEPGGAFADEARAALLRAGVEVDLDVSDRSAPRLRPALLDRLPVEARRRLQAAARREFTLGDIRGAFLSAGGIEALELRGVIELVDEPLSPERGTDALKGEAGPPIAVQALDSGKRTVIYRDTAYDLQAGKTVRRVIFQPR